MNEADSITSELDSLKQRTKSGSVFWLARDIQRLLSYADWDNFLNVVGKAKISCENAGVGIENHFREITEKVALGSGAVGKRANVVLSRYACYLIAMNGDPSKEAIALAQTYFAVQTRRQEVADASVAEVLSADEERLDLRERLKQATKGLNSAAKNSGVEHYGIFHDAGYQGLYGMSLKDIKAKKGLKKSDELFDRAGKSELAANSFKATQTAERLEREKIKGQRAASETHRKVGQEVRATIRKLGNTMPENMKPEPHINEVKRKLAAKSKTPELPDIGASGTDVPKSD